MTVVRVVVVDGDLKQGILYIVPEVGRVGQCVVVQNQEEEWPDLSPSRYSTGEVLKGRCHSLILHHLTALGKEIPQPGYYAGVETEINCFVNDSGVADKIESLF